VYTFTQLHDSVHVVIVQPWWNSALRRNEL